MDWTKVTIYTTTEGIEPVSGRLMQLGITGIVTEDETEFSFRGGEFAGSWEETLGNMLRIKEHFSRSVSIDGVEYLDHLIEDYSFTDAELELLYQLFDVSNEP